MRYALLAVLLLPHLQEGPTVEWIGSPGRVASIRRHLAVSPDGKFLADADSVTKRVLLLEFPTGRPIRSWKADGGPHGVAFGPKGDRLVLATDTGASAVRIPDGTALHHVKGRVASLDVRGTVVATGTMDGQVRLWNLEDGKERAALKPDIGPGGVLAVSLSPDATTVAAAGLRDQIVIQTVESGAEQSIPVKRRIERLSYSADGKRLVAVDSGGRCIAYDSQTREQVWATPSTLGKGTAFAFDPNGTDVWVTRGNGIARRALSDGKESGGIDLGFGADALVTDGRSLAAAGYRQPVRFFDIAAGKEIHAPIGHTMPIYAMALLDGGARLATCGGDGRLITWDLATKAPIRIITGELELTHLAVSSDGRIAVTGEPNSTLRFWDLTEGKSIHEVELPGGEGPQTVQPCPDGKSFAVAVGDSILRYGADGGELGKIAAGSTTYAMQYSPDGTLIARSVDGAVAILDAKTGTERHRVSLDKQMAYAIAWSPDGKTLATGQTDRCVVLRDPTLKEIGRLACADSVYGLSWSSDGALLAAADFETFAVWNVADRKELIKAGQLGGRTPVQLLPKGNRLIVAAVDGGMMIVQVR